VKPADAKKLLKIAQKNKAPAAVIGKVAGDRLLVDELLNIKVADLGKAYSSAIESQLK
jgi:phosphoribosylformylglycinamidine (FGAM) synthase-like enzyme